MAQNNTSDQKRKCSDKEQNNDSDPSYLQSF
jgi:hypothetical protein